MINLIRTIPITQYNPAHFNDETKTKTYGSNTKIKTQVIVKKRRKTTNCENSLGIF